ncbi:MAG: hypothetical protein WCW87_01875 [Candidatus Paceibacterota bacterium]
MNKLPKVLNLYKESGETPLERIKRFKDENLEYQNIKLSYAGRLDPLASGVLLVVVGEDNKDKEKYLNFDKEYEALVLFGVSTDTHDVLGKIKSSKSKVENLEEKVRAEIKNFKGKFFQEYPSYSSKTVNGKQLWQWAREDKLDEIEMPKKEVEIYDIQILEFFELSKEKLHKEIAEKILRVKGDFRQQEILAEWDKFFANSQKIFSIAKIKVACSSGTYIRSLANEIGKKLDIDALALDIKRTKVGEYLI